ncbi:glycosyltransferase [Ruminococcaceae bacterium OttesenSCG-928-L11]|nr:glycosyltransferase [Ruminococcaceae bacterium OttesenSCG-928-L11]
MGKECPLVSIIIPVYNGSNYMQEAIDSALAQTYPNIEVIVVNDGSNDNGATEKIALSYGKKIKYYSKINGGVASALNYGIREMQGEYFSWLSHDDMYTPDKVARQISALEEFKDSRALVYCGYQVIDVKGNHLFDVDPSQLLPKDKLDVPLLPLFRGMINGCSLLIHRRHFDEVGLFNEKLRTTQDYDLWFRMLRQSKLILVDALCVISRFHDEQDSKKLAVFFANECDDLWINMMRSISDEERIQMFGSVYEFYYHTWKFLHFQSTYNAASVYAENWILSFYAKNEDNLCNELRPDVSIIIPVYNGSNYINEAINSALSQTYHSIEVIVVDDGSNDNGLTKDIIFSYGKKIRFFSKENGGVASALNYGIKKMRGKYFSWLSHDDLYTPDKIARQMKALYKQSNDAIAFCNVFTFSEISKQIKKNEIPSNSANNIRAMLAIDTESTLNGCALLVPKYVFEQYGYFDERLKYTQDYDRWFCFASNVSFVYVNEPLVLSRQHEEQDSRKYPVLCTEESDNLHSRLISMLGEDEIGRFFAGSAKSMMEEHLVYFNAGYWKTAIRILGYICRRNAKHAPNDEFIRTINQSIFCNDDEGNTKRVWEESIRPLIQKKKIKKRILIYVNVWVRGGIERVVATLINSLWQKYEIILVYTDLMKPLGFPLFGEASHILISNSNGKKISYRLAALAHMLDADLFIGNPNIIVDLLDIYEMLRELNIKSIACNHGYFFLPYQFPWLYPIIDKRMQAYEHADVATWLTTFGANIYGQLKGNGALMPNPNTYNKAIPKTSISGKTVLAVGRFYDSVKRLDRILRVFHRVLLDHPDAKLVLVGDYNLSMHIPAESPYSIQELLDTLQIPSHSIHFAGEQDDVTSYYNEAAVFLMTSDCEGFPMTLTEASVFGLPSVLFHIPGIEDIITDGKNGFLVEQDDFVTMANKISLLLANPELCLHMGQQAQEMAERFSKEKICSRWNQLIEVTLHQDAVELQKTLEKDFMVPPSNITIFTETAVKEYEKHISMVNSNILPMAEEIVPEEAILPPIEEPQVDVLPPLENMAVNDAVICTHCINDVHKTFSWRITRPLRWVRMTQLSLKNHGLIVTLRKIRRRFRNKFYSISRHGS